MRILKTFVMTVIVIGMLAMSAAAQAHQRMLGINSAGNLYEIDPNSGAAIFLGDTGIPGTITSMTADSAGTLWVINTQGSKAMLFSIPFGQVVAGPGTQISLADSPFTDYTWIQGMSFDTNGVLLATGNRMDNLPTPNELITIDTSDATAVPIGPFLSPAFPCIEDVDSLAMSSTGALFGWDSDGFACFNNLHRFLSIDPMTGAATPVGAPYPFSTSVFALQFDQGDTLFGARHPGNAGGDATLVTITTDDGVISDIALIIDESGTTVRTVVGLAFVDFDCVNPCPTDINGDGVTDTADLGILLDAFGSICN